MIAGEMMSGFFPSEIGSHHNQPCTLQICKMEGFEIFKTKNVRKSNSIHTVQTAP